jgi:chromosome segregation ATPase
MSSRISLQKSNIIKRLSKPSISEIKYKEILLNTLREKENELNLKKKSTMETHIRHKSIESNMESSEEKKNKKYIHDLELKIEELENVRKLKDEELVNVNKNLEDEKNKAQKLSDIIDKKEKQIELLKKSFTKYEKQIDENNGNNKETPQNKLIKIDIINKKVEYNLNMENNQLKEELKMINDENLKLKNELKTNKETIINLEKTIENYKNEIKILLNEKQKGEENKKKLKGKNIINEKSNNLINEEIRKLKNEITELKFLNEKYKNEIKDKDNIIFKLKEENKYYIKEKNNADKKIIEINNIHQILQKELEDIKLSVKEKENYYNNIINNFKEEAIQAKIKFADTKYQNDVKYMKLKKHFDKLVEVLNSSGIKIKEIK